jgi:regulation of enolase protein 1 (concanavalin A-like superfamily)
VHGEPAIVEAGCVPPRAASLLPVYGLGGSAEDDEIRLGEEGQFWDGGQAYNLHTMLRLLLPCLLAVSAFAQTGTLGLFTNSGDVGGPARKGSTEFDAGKAQYRITGSGANMWAKEDQFQYVWREMSGNVAVTATVQFLGEGNVHRKAGIVLRQTLDSDSPYIDIVIHGNGMPGIQWRNTKSDITNAMDFPFDAPAKYKLRLVRQGSAVTVSIARDDAPLKELGHTQVQLGNPILVGLAVCSHNAEASDTVIFSDVSVEQLAAPAGKKQ